MPIETKYIANCIHRSMMACENNNNKAYQLCTDIAEAFKIAAASGLDAGHKQLMEILKDAEENNKYR